MSTEDNKALVRQVFEGFMNQGNMALINELYSPDYIKHASRGPDHGQDGLKQYFMLYRSAFPDALYTVEDQIAEGDRVVTRWLARGSHQGSLMGIPPTGKQGKVTGISIVRLEGGRIAEAWMEFDALGMFQQLGVIPVPGRGSSHLSPFSPLRTR